MYIKKRVKKLKMILLILFGALLLVGGIILTASGVFVKSDYLEPWSKSYAKKFEDPRIKLVAHGLLAANNHNYQPWTIELDNTDPSSFYLYVDSNRLATEVDPYARQTMISQGTFLEYMLVAGKHLGYRVEIQLFPNGDFDEKNLIESMDTLPVAKITWSKAKKENHPLYRYIFVQDTNREIYQPVPLSDNERKELLVINDQPDITLMLFEEDKDIDRLGYYVMEVAIIESQIQSINNKTAEIFRANENEKNRYRYGYSFEGQGISGVKMHILQGLITIFPFMNSEEASVDMFIKSTQNAVDHTPAYALLLSNDNSRLSQVKSGMLYSRLELMAHSLGFVLHPTSQVLQEYEEMNNIYNDFHNEYAPEGSTIQMLIRLGKPTQEFPQTMRRDVLELIKDN